MGVTPTRNDAPSAAPLPGDEPAACPRCGTPSQPDQEYCLECGLRLPAARSVVGSIASAWERKLGYYPGDWVWPALVGLLIAGLATAVVIAVSHEGAEPTTLVATGRTVPARTTTTTAPTGTTTGPQTGPTATAPTTTAATEPPPPPPPSRNELREWPSGRNGYTVVLESIPTGGGRALALSKARAALGKGVRDVGVLNSSLYSSLHPGYYVVFSGVFDSLADATRAESRAQARGYPLAYARQITT